jgi:hypothetical protein
MRPTPFFIEIPDRPVYQPGSGPAMAPITLQPDDSDTGWVIAGTVDFQGISQYVVTPKDNPAHRRPVKKQHILDWVSPKAHEDFEYTQYKIQTEAEREKESRIMAKAVAVRKRIQGVGLAREQAKARKPFARYMQLEQVDDSDRGNTSKQLSSPEHSSDDLNSGMLPGRSESTKRKRSVGFPQEKEPAVKRRGPTSSSKAPLVWKAWKPPLLGSSRQGQVERTGDETDEEGEARDTPEYDNGQLRRLNTFDRPSLPTQRRLSTHSRTSVAQKPSVFSYSEPSLFVPATASPSPKLRRSVLSPPLLASGNYPKSASPSTQPETKYPRKVTVLQKPSNGRTCSPILPPTKLCKPPASKPVSTTFHVALARVGESSRGRTLKRKRHSLSPTDESTAAGESSDVNGMSNDHRSKRAYETEAMGRSHFSDIAASRSTWVSVDHKASKPEKREGSRSSSSGSSNILIWPSNHKSAKVSNEQSKYFAGMKMKQNDKEDVEEDEKEEEDSNETWDIHGLLDDEMRRVNGQLVRHYLVEWVGDWDPTWEPEQNVSTEAITIYEKKKRRDSLGFDGAADVDVISKNGEAPDQNTLRILDDIHGLENEASDSEAFTDAPTDATTFLTADENPRSHSETGSTAEEIVAIHAELL